MICFGAATILASLAVLKLANGFDDDVFFLLLMMVNLAGDIFSEFGVAMDFAGEIFIVFSIVECFLFVELAHSARPLLRAMGGSRSSDPIQSRCIDSQSS